MQDVTGLTKNPLSEVFAGVDLVKRGAWMDDFNERNPYLMSKHGTWLDPPAKKVSSGGGGQWRAKKGPAIMRVEIAADEFDRYQAYRQQLESSVSDVSYFVLMFLC